MCFSTHGPIQSHRKLPADGTEVDGYSLRGDSAGNKLIQNFAFNTIGSGFDMSTSAVRNTLKNNTSDGNAELGMSDVWVGPRTAGTAHTYEGNLCNANAAGDSSPSGLSGDQGTE
jgi:hypothetical protein